MEESTSTGGNMAISIKRRQERLKRMLLERSRELETNLRQELATRMKEGPALFASARDEGDFGLFGFEQEISRRRMITCNEKLKKITDALERLSQDIYGICEECGAEIGEKRLQVLPFAAFCLECQETLEEKEVSERIIAWAERKNQSGEH
jgi:DnaK suppressor protein